MLPIPTGTAVLVFFGLVGMLAAGLTTQSAPTIALASGGFVGVGLVLAATMPLGRRLRRQRLEFAWWLDHGTGVASGAAVPHSPFVVRCYVRHRGAEAITVEALEPLLSAGAELLERPRAVRLDGRSRTEFTLRLTAPAAGRVVLHGLAVQLRGPFGLFSTPLYFPNPLVIKVLPRAAAGRTRRAPIAQASSMERAGRTMVRRRGGGTELHELRELVPGDPFKSIAWKASARRGRLMVKEVEQEVQQTRWILVDVSGTMRAGEPGERKLDYALEAAAADAREALEAGDRVGLVAFDGRIVSHVPAGEGKAQRLRIYEALLAATEIVDEDLTDLSEAELLGRVARYVRQQDGIDFARGKGRGGRTQLVDRSGLAAHVRRMLGDEAEAKPFEREVQAESATGRLLRRFCRARGLPLPHRADPGDHAKARALASALQAVGGRSRSPAALLVCTDFDTIDDATPVVKALQLVKAHGHRVAFVLPDGRSFADEWEGVAADLARIYGRVEARRLDEARRLLGGLGVRVVVAQRSDPPGLAAIRARAARRRAA